ncbi:hypothetical protein E2562_011918 [Oryza meyeriana var. granulata]|uniref:Cytochrome P450 n=1 Tax=Oryza meyeriana var. granulata TaxID=110450 RepID=A0A6G1CE09_9ORYZ|nr:hypothetical protein E2562_011918 [Oryza meyeriana var. granulata]
MGPLFSRDLLSDGIFSADDEVWRRQRKAASLEFLYSAEFRALTASSLVKLMHRRLLPVLADAKAAGAANPGCLWLSLLEIPFAKAFEDAIETTILRFVMSTTVWHRKEEVAVEEETAPSAGRRSGLLTVFTKMRDTNTGAPYYDKFLDDIYINFILAKHDTSSVALAWFF